MARNRLAIDISPLSHDGRGMGFFLKEFLRHLILVDHNFTIHLVAKKKIEEKRWPFPVVDPKSLNDSWITWFPFNCPSFRPQGKYAVTLHDLAPFIFPQGESRLRKKIEQGAKGAEKIFVDSRFIGNEVLNILKVSASKIEWIPPGFDPEWPEKEVFHPPKPYLLSVGPAEPRKNFDRLIKAFHKLKKRNFPHKLVIVGELSPRRKAIGPFIFEFDNPLPGLARRLGRRDEVIFPGVVDRSELRQWYLRASLLVVPSLYEGFGFPVLEAYSCNTPVVSSNAASLPEVAGEGAFYFNPYDVESMADTIENALTNPAGIAKKQELAQIQLTKFNWRYCIQQYFDVFRKM